MCLLCPLVATGLDGCKAGAVTGNGPPASQQAAVPVLSGGLAGAKQAVFDTRDACEEIDIPDAPARAFRDFQGVVHLMATHYVARAMTGPSLDKLRHDCHVVYRSPRDFNPAHFEYKNWVYSFYTEDGRRIASLVHSEYDGEEIPGRCATPDNTNNCWWNTITYAESDDGGGSFAEAKPPANLVAALPYPYVVGNSESAYGYSTPTNIVKAGGFYYALINDWPYREQRYGPCLIRTSNVFDPGSWRAWDGNGYTVRFVDPYAEPNAKPEEHVCAPVFAGTAESLVQDARSGTYVTTQMVPDDRFGGPPGFYVEGSRDLIHWSHPVPLVRFSDLKADEDPGRYTYGYESLLDPSSTDRNFATLLETPYLYYVRSDQDHPPYARVLFRRPVQLHFGK